MRLFFLIAICLVSWVPVARAETVVDHSLYAGVLAAYVSNGRVDYAELKAHRGPLDEYLVGLAKVSPDKLERNERLAYYINLYNAATLRLIVDNYPVKSIKDIGWFLASPWKRPILSLEGKMVSLDHVEHDIIRPQFAEPRVHFALNCSARSCPPLLSEPYTGRQLDAQLSRATRDFLNDPSRNHLNDGTLYVSKIFDWYSEDFPENLVAWIIRHASGSLQQNLVRLTGEGKDVKLKYLEYDWGLNDVPR